MHLAQELVDYIIDFLHDDPNSLIRVSLVSRAWVGRARTHLYKSLKITHSKLFSLNPFYLPPLSRYVKTLHVQWLGDIVEVSTILDCFWQSDLHTLAIHSCELRILDEQTIRHCFAKFPCMSIATLELHDITPTHRTLLILLSLFPNVDNLAISVNRWWKDRPGPGLLGTNDNGITQSISPPRLRGSFKLFDPPHHRPWVFHRSRLLRTMATLPLQFQTVSLGIGGQSWLEVLTFLNSCSKTLRKVFVAPTYPHQPLDPLPPADLANLEELYVSGDPLLRSVASPHLRRATVDLRKTPVQFSLLDEVLVNLIQRHKPYGNLALRILTTTDPEEIRRSLPRVAQEGVLKVVDKSYNRAHAWANQGYQGRVSSKGHGELL